MWSFTLAPAALQLFDGHACGPIATSLSAWNRRGPRESGGVIGSHLEGDYQVDLVAHLPDELGPQVAREPDLGLLCGRNHKVRRRREVEDISEELDVVVWHLKIVLSIV